MSGLEVTAITPPIIMAWQITTATATDAVAAINAVVAAGWKVQVNVSLTNNIPVWQVSILQQGSQPLVANNYDWIVYDGSKLATYPNSAFVTLYTANVQMAWAPTQVAPVATAQSGRKAVINCPTPTSANGPWNYGCSITNITSGTITAETLGAAVVSGSQVSFTADDLIEGDNYTFTITCSTQYEGVNATSMASNLITATA